MLARISHFSHLSRSPSDNGKANARLNRGHQITAPDAGHRCRGSVHSLVRWAGHALATRKGGNDPTHMDARPFLLSKSSTTNPSSASINSVSPISPNPSTTSHYPRSSHSRSSNMYTGEATTKKEKTRASPAATSTPAAVGGRTYLEYHSAGEQIVTNKTASYR